MDAWSFAARTKRRVVVCFVDLAGFARAAEFVDDEPLAARLDAYYERVGDAASAAGGVVVKVMGDGALLLFPVERADDAVRALLALRDDVAALCADWGARLVVKVHVGDVVCGPFGPRGDKRLDAIGGEVNIAARLPTKDFALSAEAFRALSSEARSAFKKHTPPVTYLPVDDQRPSRVAKR
jgi:class 3 adenylate cyclase